MVDIHNNDIQKLSNEWTQYVEDRDSEWTSVIENAYNIGYSDGTYKTVTDIAEITGTVGRLLIFI